MKRTETFHFLFPLTQRRNDNGLWKTVHIADLEVTYKGYYWPEQEGWADPYDIDIDSVLTSSGFELRGLMNADAMQDLLAEITNEAKNNVAKAFKRIDGIPITLNRAS